MSKINLSKVKSYYCSVDGYEHETVVHATTAGKARYRFWMDCSDCLPDLTLMQIKVRVGGAPITSDGFKRMAEYRGIPFAHCGMRVKFGEDSGVIVGHNSSACLDVLFENGDVLNCHPHNLRFFDANGREVKA